MSGRVCVCVMLPPPTHRVDSRGRRYGDVTMQLHGVMGVVEEFRKYQSIPQIKQLIDRLQSLQYDLGQQIKVDFEKAFSIKGAPVSYIVTPISMVTMLPPARNKGSSPRCLFGD